MPGARLINPQTGKEEFFLEEQLKGALDAGYIPDPGKRYNVVDVSGRVVSVDAKQFLNYVERDSPIEDLESVRNRASEKYLDDAYGGVLGGVGATLKGALSGATGGLSDIALKKLGKYSAGNILNDSVIARDLEAAQGLNPGTRSTRSAAEFMEQDAPILHGVGEVAGIIGTAGASLAGKAGAKFLPAGAAAVVGEAAFKKVAGTAGAGIARKAAAGTAAGAVDVGIYSGVQSFSDAVINDKGLSAETAFDIFGDAAKGAALGGAFGGGASLIGSGAKKVIAKKALKLEPRLVANTPEHVAYVSEMKTAITSLDDAASLVSKSAENELRLLKRLKASPDEIAQVRQVRKAVSRDVNALRSSFSMRREIDNTLSSSDKTFSRFVTSQSKSQGRQLKAIANLTNTIEKAKQLKFKASPELAARLDEVVKPFEIKLAESTAAATGGLNSLDALAIANELGLDAGIIPEGSLVDSALKVYGATRLVKGGAKAIRKGSKRKAIEGALERSASISVARSTRNRGTGFAGSVQAGLMGTAAGAGLRHVFNKFGNASEAVAAKTSATKEKMVKVAKVMTSPLGKTGQQKSRRTMNAILSQTMFSEGDKAEIRKQNRGVQVLFRERAEEVAKLASDRRTLELKIKAKMPAFMLENPAVADGIVVNTVNKIQYIASQIPSIPQNNSLTPKRTMPIPESEINKFAQILRLADPNEFIEDVAAGRLTKMSVKAAQFMYPEVYNQMRTMIVNNLQELREDLPYDKRRNISAFMGVPVEKSFEPEYTMRLQNNHYPEEEGGTEPAAPKSGASMKSFSQQLTAGQHIQEK